MVTIIYPITHSMILSEISKDFNSTLALRLLRKCTQPSGEYDLGESAEAHSLKFVRLIFLQNYPEILGSFSHLIIDGGSAI